MAQALRHLCCELIQSTHGELCASIFSFLAEHGRSTVPQIIHGTKLKPRQVRYGMTVLLETQIVQRYLSDERAAAVYQVDYRVAYDLARHDSIVRLVEERWGTNAASIVEAVLEIGHARVGDVIDGLVRTTSRRVGTDDAAMHNDGIPNGTSHVNGGRQADKPKDHSVGYWHSLTRTLLNAGILVKASARSYIPFHDLQEEMEYTVISERFRDGKVSGPKKKKEFQSAVESLKRQWQEDDEYSDERDVASLGANRYSNKRMKLNGWHATVPGSADTGDDTFRLSPDLVVRANQSRYVVAMRSKCLQRLAERYLGEITGAVYGALLRGLESKYRNMQDKQTSQDDDHHLQITPALNITEINEQLDPRIDVSTAIKGLVSNRAALNGHAKGRKRTRDHDNGHDGEDGIKAEYDSDDGMGRRPEAMTDIQSRNQRLSAIEAHLCVLEEHSKSFCKRCDAHEGRNEWQVDFAHLNQILIQAEIDQVVLDGHGQIQLRLVHLLREKGKLDEKQIASMGLLFTKDVYSLLTRLQFSQILESQEIPKDNLRQPNKSIFLWYIDDTRVKDQLLQKTYKIMTRHLQRVYAERERHKTILEKASRSDVKGREQEKLSAGEKQILRQLRDTEERLSSQVSRLDELVGIFRDFGGIDSSLR